jgi:hypothetical protein
MLMASCGTVLLFACRQKKESRYQAGDILMQQIECGPLCDAINKVTEGYQGKDYNHCALVVNFQNKKSDSLVVIEAIGAEVHYSGIPQFLARVGDTVAIKNTLHTRLKKPYRSLIPEAITAAHTFLGQPYDDGFFLNNGKMYCSEVIHDAFQKANDGKAFFECQPMTFKDPETQAFFPPWEAYYKDLKVEIPEGVPGINPGLISRDVRLEIIPN